MCELCNRFNELCRMINSFDFVSLDSNRLVELSITTAKKNCVGTISPKSFIPLLLWTKYTAFAFFFFKDFFFYCTHKQWEMERVFAKKRSEVNLHKFPTNALSMTSDNQAKHSMLSSDFTTKRKRHDGNNMNCSTNDAHSFSSKLQWLRCSGALFRCKLQYAFKLRKLSVSIFMQTKKGWNKQLNVMLRLWSSPVK